MSRVTIRELVDDYKRDGFEERYPHMIHNVEVAPRRIIELIIAQCEEDVKDVGRWQDPFDQGRTHEASKIKGYAESLLKQFEVD